MSSKKLFKSIGFCCLLLLAQTGFAQDRVITGKVTDSKNGSRVPSATVAAKGSSAATQSDADGSYKIFVAPSVTTLVFSSIGYEMQEVLIGDKSSIDVQLLNSTSSLSEVVVIGYGTVRKKDLTGSVTQISSKDFNKGPQSTPEQLILGKIPGVQITSGGGRPGSGSRIRIRQGASLNASNDPLIVLDGVPLEHGGISGVANPLALVNPSDIESFNILKDASAAAIYGNRASNGVIIITTKKGATGKLKLSYNSNVSYSTITKTPDVLNAKEFSDLVNAKGTTAQKALLGKTTTNWQDLIYRDAVSTDNNISFSGGIKNFPYRVSLGFLNQDGILLNDNLQRTSVALNLNPKFLNNHLSVDFNFKNASSISKFANQGAIGSAVFFDPTQAVYDNGKPQYGGYWEWELNGLPNTLAPKNPISLLEQLSNIGYTDRIISNLQIDYKIKWLPELRANLNLGYDMSNGYGNSTTPATSAAGYYSQGSKSKYEQKRWNKLVDFYLNYVKNIPSIKSRIDVTAGHNYQDWVNSSPSFPVINGNGTIPAGSNYKSQHTLVSVFGRVNYAYDDRYLLTASVRRDGSSRFSPDNRWGLFPSVALAWRVSNESFLKDMKVISDLKFRLGWGITGQQDIGSDYPYLARYSLSDSSAMYQLGNSYTLLLRPEGYDENLKWEETETFNAGVDFGFLNGRISGSVDAYFKKTKDLLAVIPVPAGSNLTNQILTNVGNIENKGIEVSLSGTPIRTNKFAWDANVNFTYNESKITNLSKVQDANSIGNQVGGIAGGVGNTVQVHTVGFAPYSFYLNKQVYNQAGVPIEGLYVDMNKDGAANEKDKYRYKNPEPKMFVGFGSQFSYSKWTMSVAARASIDNYMYNNFNSNSGTLQGFSFSNYLSNVSRDVLTTNFATPKLWSDYYMENASFIRIDNINLGYNVGKIFTSATLRLSANVQNAFVITNYSGVDPEIAGGIDNNFYPRPRVYSLGVNLDF